MTTPTKTTISKDTLVPLGLVITLLAGAWWFNSEFAHMKYSLNTMQADIGRMQAKLVEAGTDRWKRADMKLWIELMKASNQGKDINIPEIPK